MKTSPTNAFEFACPICQGPLVSPSADEQTCLQDQAVYRRVDGVWRFLPPARAASLAQFLREYETVRAAEGRGSQDPAYYRALPFADLTGRFANDWRIRAKSYQALIAHVIAPLEAKQTPLKILDLGAGNGWLAYQLSQRGHCAAAVDLMTNAADGLGAWVQYDAAFTPIQAEFDRLPLAADQVDLAIFNSSFHYSVDYAATLRQVLRTVKECGAVVILDTPIYADAASGAQMVVERQAHFTRTYGFPSNALASENYLTYDRLSSLGQALNVEWDVRRPFRGWRWALRPWLARARGQREPAEFLLITGQRKPLEHKKLWNTKPTKGRENREIKPMHREKKDA